MSSVQTSDIVVGISGPIPPLLHARMSSGDAIACMIDGGNAAASSNYQITPGVPAAWSVASIHLRRMSIMSFRIAATARYSRHRH